VRDLSGLGEPWAKIRAQYNVPGGMGIVEAVDHIVAEFSRSRALYKENCRSSCSLPVLAMFSKEPQASSRVLGPSTMWQGMGIVEAVDHIVAESSRRPALYKENCRRSCSLPVVAMFSKEPRSSSRVMDIVSGLDWARIRVHYDVIVAAQNAGILPLTPNRVIDSEFYSFSPPSLDVQALFDTKLGFFSLFED
jgi:hypothetical protein